MSYPFPADDDNQPLDGLQPAEDAEQAPEESNNRTFLIAAAGIAVVVLLSLICLAGYALWYVPRNNAMQATQQFQVNANNTQVAAAFTSTAMVSLFTPTAEMPTATITPVLALPTETPLPPTVTVDPITATVAAAYTQAAIAQQTVIPTSTALSQVPSTGFADEVGLPGLFLMGLVLVVVILLARRLRAAPLR